MLCLLSRNITPIGQYNRTNYISLSAVKMLLVHGIRKVKDHACAIFCYLQLSTGHTTEGFFFFFFLGGGGGFPSHAIARNSKSMTNLIRVIFIDLNPYSSLAITPFFFYSIEVMVCICLQSIRVMQKYVDAQYFIVSIFS